MRIAVWKTGHEIADTVADRIANALGAECLQTSDATEARIRNFDVHIAYGILRGTGELFKIADAAGMPWFHIDRGYTNPGHYDGNYRISYKGTQFKWHEEIPRKPVDVKFEPWKGGGAYVLICPPSEAVCEFFNISINHWLFTAGNQAVEMGCCPMVRYKDDPLPLSDILPKTKAVITFNSTVGIEALKRGIPVLSDVNHSAIGSFYGVTDYYTLIDKLQNKPDNRIELFEAMEAHQFKLSDTSGLWDLLSHYLYSSATTGGKQSPQMSLRTPSLSAPSITLKSHFSNTAN